MTNYVKEIKKRELVDILKKPLEEHGMGGSEIYKLIIPEQYHGRQILQRGPYESHATYHGLPQGTYSVPIQFGSGFYPELEKEIDLFCIDLVTILHKDFFEGRVILTDDNEIYRPLTDGYLDADHKEWEDEVSYYLDDGEDNPQRVQLKKYRESFAIKTIHSFETPIGEPVDITNFCRMVDEHVAQFVKQYKGSRFFRNKERTLLESCKIK